MADTLKFAAAPPWSLASTLSSTATTIILNNVKGRDGTALTMTDFGTTGWSTIEPGGSSMELISFTGISGTSLTGVTRGLKFEADYTQDTALRLPHQSGSAVVISDAPQLFDAMYGKANDETVTGVWDFSTSPTVPTGGTGTQAANATDIANAIIGASGTATTTVAGTVEIATDAELAAGTATGATGASVVPNGTSFKQAPTASKVVVADSTAKIGDGWLGLTTAGDLPYSDGTDLQRLAKGTTGLFLEAGASAPTWGGANLAEANTFFGASDITGAEAQTLTGGTASDATALHFHNKYVGDLGQTSSNAAMLTTTQDISLSVDVGFVPHSFSAFVSGDAADNRQFDYGSTSGVCRQSAKIDGVIGGAVTYLYLQNNSAGINPNSAGILNPLGGGDATLPQFIGSWGSGTTASPGLPSLTPGTTTSSIVMKSITLSSTTLTFTWTFTKGDRNCGVRIGVHQLVCDA